MTLIWLGVLLVFGGVLQMVFQPIWRGRLSGGRRLRSGQPGDTLEPERPASGFGIKSNWPGLASGRAWRRFLAGRGCHLSLKLTSSALSGVAHYFGRRIRCSSHVSSWRERTWRKGPMMSALEGWSDRSTQHFILEGKDGVRDGTKIS